MALGKIARAKSPPQTKNRGQRLTLTVDTTSLVITSAGDGVAASAAARQARRVSPRERRVAS